LSTADLYVQLIHRLADYDDATVLALLIARGATEAEFRSTSRNLAEVDLAGVLNRSKVQRAVSRLVARGLLQTQARPNRWTGYKVNEDRLLDLLAQPVAIADALQRLSQHPIPFLARLQSGSTIDVTATRAASTPLKEA
jgi:hypothetical protein